MIFKYQYCMGGMGRGFPFAILKPTHHNDFLAIQLEPEMKIHGIEFSFTSVFLNILVYTCIIWFILFIKGRVHSRYTQKNQKRK